MHCNHIRSLVGAVSLAAISLGVSQGSTLHLEKADLSSMSSGWGKASKNLSITGKKLSIGGVKFDVGIGTHAESVLMIRLDGKGQTFSALVGVDDNQTINTPASVIFKVFGDGRELWNSGICRPGEKAKSCEVVVKGVRFLDLVVTDAGDGIDSDHAVWARPLLTYSGEAPKLGPPPAPEEEPFILTPAPKKEPRINGPRITGLRPGSPLIFRVPCTGERPIRFSAQGLPKGIVLDAEKGILTGSTDLRGTHQIKLSAKNSHGQATRELRLVVGDKLALTPPMGWNSWYIHYNRVNENHMRRAADLMVTSGMADHGYSYVNIDDCWMKKKGDKPYRDSDGDVLANGKFPDMKGMVDHIHSYGLRAGIYTSPGPWTCAGYVGAFGYEARDAAWYARMGFDFLKHDWCSYQINGEPFNRKGLIYPYKLMWDELQKQPRDIVFNLCQYGWGNVWEWGASVGHCWRTTGDLGLEDDKRLPGFYTIGMSTAQHWKHAGPGGWNDPDYLLIGHVGDARVSGKGVPTKLSPNEQYSYVSMWSLLAAPLIFSGDMEKLDPFTINLLCNPEVIDINQDPLGKQARIVVQDHYNFILAKPLEDGSTAVGLFNLAPVERTVSVDLAQLELQGSIKVRDAWRHKDMGRTGKKLSYKIPRHGVMLLKLSPE